MTTAQDFLDYAYTVNDAAKAEAAEHIRAEDDKRMTLLAEFADCKLIVTSLRALQEATGNRLVASVSKREFQGTAEILIRDTRVANRLMNAQGTHTDLAHGFKIDISSSEVVLRLVAESGSMYGGGSTDHGHHTKINGADNALVHVFGWAGNNKDEDGKWYIERPKFYLASFNRDKPAPTQ